MTVMALSASDYHRDALDTDRPSLSASIAAILCAKSPAHAWVAHPRLNPDFRREHSERFDIGTAAHALLLEGEAAVELVDADDWRTNAAKEARDAARLAGRLPLLAKHWDAVVTMTEAARIQLAGMNARPPLFTDGEPEQTLVWEEPNGVLCRSRLDWLRDDRKAVDDLKTTSKSAAPEAYARALFSVGGDVQAAFYLRGCRALGFDPQFRWVVVETSPPHALSVIVPGPDVLTLGDAKVEHAIQKWGECVDRDVWPTYTSEVCTAELPAYEEARWLEREERDAA